MVTLRRGYAWRKIFAQPSVISSMMSAPTRLSSSSGTEVTVPGVQAGIDGSALRWCSTAAYLSANAEFNRVSESAAATASRHAGTDSFGFIWGGGKGFRQGGADYLRE